MAETKKKQVGELNGKYALLFRVNMWLIPIVAVKLFSWGIWVSYNQVLDNEFRKQGDRVTAVMAEAAHLKIVAQVKDWVIGREERLHPRDVRSKN